MVSPTERREISNIAKSLGLSSSSFLRFLVKFWIRHENLLTSEEQKELINLNKHPKAMHEE
jgi:hypothetical protein